MAKVQKLSEILSIPTSVFADNGVFDPFIGVDTHLFLDPALLRETSIPEFSNSYGKIVTHFSEVLRLVRASKRPYDIAWREACKRLVFRETRGISIGYGANRSDGSGIGPKLARQILETAIELVHLGVDDPILFQLVPLFEPNLGADRLSDMAISIIRDDVYAYTGRMVKELGVKSEYLCAPRNSRTGKTVTAINNPNGGSPLFLIPEELLKDLPLALERDNVGYISYFNEQLRRRLSTMIVGEASKSLRDLHKEDFRELLMNKVDFEQAVADYRVAHATPYDFKNDPAGEIAWYEQGREFAKKNPIEIALNKPKTLEDVNIIVRAIIDQFKKSIENHNLYELLYKEPIKALQPKNERAAQRLFYAIADAYCEANNIILSREPNSGNGPVDFKIGSDYHTQVLVELKLSSGKVRSGYERQLPEYEKNEGSANSFYVVLRVTDSNKAMQDIQETSNIARAEGRSVPMVILINALPRESASKK